MWIARKTSANSDMRRCTPSVTNRGQRAEERRATSATPSATTSVSSTSATTPVARVRYQYAVEEEPNAGSSMRSAAPGDDRRRGGGSDHRRDRGGRRVTTGDELDCVESFDELELFDDWSRRGSSRSTSSSRASSRPCGGPASTSTGALVVVVVVFAVVVFATTDVDATFRVLVCPSGALATISTSRPVPRTAAIVSDRLTRLSRVRAASRVACARVRIGPP